MPPASKGHDQRDEVADAPHTVAAEGLGLADFAEAGDGLGYEGDSDGGDEGYLVHEGWHRPEHGIVVGSRAEGGEDGKDCQDRESHRG